MSNIEKQLRGDEGEKLVAYQDHLGFWTISIGVLIDGRKGGGITKEESSYLFNNRLKAKEEELRRRLPVFATLDEARQGVLLNMAYQMGVDGLLRFPAMLRAVQAKDWTKAAAEILDSKYAREDTPARAKRMARQMESGVWQYA